jgi:hypothetical protein
VTLDRRALWNTLGVVYVLSFGLNLVWEMLQMPLFGGMDWSPTSWAFCTVASLGDATFSAAAYVVLALRHRDARWFRVRDTRDLLLVTAAGLLVSTVGESMGRMLSWWSYTPLMPLVPGLEVGALPFVQLAILSVVTFEILHARTPRTQRA